MARKKIVPEEEVSKPAMAEETTATDVDDEAPADLMPDSNAEESATSEAVPTETLLEGINGNDAEGSVQAEKSESISAEKASEEAMSVEDASVSEEELPAGSEHADASIEEVTTEPESASDALSEAAILCDADEDGNSVSDMVPQEISELHDEAEEAAEYSVDFSEEPETVSPESTPISSTEESDWGFQEPKKEITEEEELEPPLETPVSVESPKAVPKSDRQLFYELKFNNLDRGLTPEERQEWNSIYASYRGRSAITGTIIGVDPHSIYVWNPETERREKKTMYCAIVVPYRVRIVIPASEMWEAGNERPDYVLQNMVGASIDLIIIKVEREAGFAIGSRRLASRSQRYFFAHREDIHRIGSRVKCRMLAVGPRRCLVDCYGHDLDLTQREMRYAAIPDLRDEYHPGMELESIVKVYDSTKDELIISVKETETNPILGAEQRHPVGSRRLAVISGKYGGGVFCNLPDGVVCMCNYSFQHEDSDFMVGENVMLVVQRYNEEKLQMFGKILSKW